ncbi:cell division cycle protein 27 homolog B isoform X2 [Dioscorea cayenensis subsp. rotundata]|uniref:Cell division cycle protein 27 homolog B isoform X2 n=1 Tax=Dioscorea cayennensis subsp. rotundata TaxID=55577 RepID=A0AB40CTZ1_DIOCR|nr:cell division cycle protein 27 homolog B isoform X2 [Dioscorea cayenensis subsp. rotundata]
METLLMDRVQSSLRLFMPKNAIFLCERLCAEFPTESNLQLLANCYLGNNQAYCAYHILKGKQMPQSRYLFAISCFQMNLLREAEAALSPANEPNSEVPNGAAGHYLLGLIYRYTSRRSSAVDHFTQALSIDPLLWAAYEELCILGAVGGASDYFSDVAASRIQQQYLSESSSHKISIGDEDRSIQSSRVLGLNDSSPKQPKNLHSNSIKEISNTHVVMAAGQAANSGSSNLSLYNTPSPVASQLSGIAPPPLCRNGFFNAVSCDGSSKPAANAAILAPRRKAMEEGRLRKVSGRLFSDSGPRRSTRLSGEATAGINSNASQAGGGTGTNHSSSSRFLGGFSSSSSKTSSAAFRTMTGRKGPSCISESFDEGRKTEVFGDSCGEDASATMSSVAIFVDCRYLEEDKINLHAGGLSVHDSKLINGIRELLGLLRTLGEGYRFSCMHRSQEALEVYQKLSQNQYNTGWVLSQIGKAHFEMVDYFEAARFFDLARRVSPYSLEGMDIYSTILYHLKEEMKLSYLAQELISTDRLAPQAWCAMGNCYSLQKDHETALKNFQRAVHLDSRFAYAHTLSGHEYVALEDFENGIKCYQRALQVDERHYNSWYGLGVIYLRQEKFQFAEHHFRRAFFINPRSSVLMCYLGMSLHSLRRNEEALEMIEKAILADPKNPLPLYQKANILLSLERYDEALMNLDQLKECAPQETSVYALMGKIYKKLNMHEKAMFYFGLALDLKPPATDVAIIKSAMEKLYLPDEMGDSL